MKILDKRTEDAKRMLYPRTRAVKRGKFLELSPLNSEKLILIFSFSHLFFNYYINFLLLGKITEEILGKMYFIRF
jgi:hypothetical protein